MADRGDYALTVERERDALRAVLLRLGARVLDTDQVTGVEGEPMSSLFAEGAATERAAIVKFLRSEALNNGHPNVLLVAARRIDEQQHHAH